MTEKRKPGRPPGSKFGESQHMRFRQHQVDGLKKLWPEKEFSTAVRDAIDIVLERDAVDRVLNDTDAPKKENNGETNTEAAPAQGAQEGQPASRAGG